MRIPTVQKCCCCLDLRIGVLALIGLVIVLNICYFVHVFTILAGACAVAGIHKQISYWPYLLAPLLVIGVMAIITLILLPFFTYDHFSKNYDEGGHDPVVVFFIFLFMWLVAAVTSYLWIIVFSLFESMRQEASSKSGATKFTTP